MQSYISPWPPLLEPEPFPRSLAVLGSTGSIGKSALDVVRRHPSLFTVTALTGGRNGALLIEQAAEFKPPVLAVRDLETADQVRAGLPPGYAPEILTGPQGFTAVAAMDEVRVVLSAIVGSAGFAPTLAAAESGKWIALANKESLVLGGHLIRAACHDSGAAILPVDSEHNALFQGLAGHRARDLDRLVLTASGGPFRGRSREELAQVTPEQALNHPNWDMGAKVTIDSATLMNKGLELMEACHLYGMAPERVHVVIHPQSIIHSLVEYVDGSLLAHLGVPDMRIPIAHALCYPQRVDTGTPRLDLAQVAKLTFEEPDEQAFPCLGLAKQAFAAGPSFAGALNAANEEAVTAFLEHRIGFLDIPEAIGRTLESHQPGDMDTAEAVLDLDRRARVEARIIIEEIATQ